MTTSTTKREPSIVELDAVVIVRTVMRTPSPSPSEAEALQKSSLKSINWRAIGRSKRSCTFTPSHTVPVRNNISFSPGYLYISSAIILTLTILIAVYRLRIEKWLEPRADAVRKYATTYVCFLSAVRHKLISSSPSNP